MSVRWRVLVGVVAVVGMLACGSGSKSGGGSPTTTPANTSAPATTATTAAAGPASSFSDGTHEVGKDIAAGKYVTTVPADSYGCYWARLKGFSGASSDIIANDNAEPNTRAVVTIAPTDKGFQSNRCGTWTKT